MNSFTIVQNEKQTQLAISVHRNAEISSIRLARMKATADRPEEVLNDPIVLSVDVRAKHVERQLGPLLIEVNMRLTGSKKSGKSKSTNAICVECTFEVEYELRPGFTPTPEQVRAFKDANAIFNCWPYCRQHVQDVLARMGYNPPPLPLMRVQTGNRQSRKQSKPN